MSVKRAQEIIEKSKPHKIYFSIDGGSNTSHDKNRGKGTFEKALQGLKNMLKANQKNKKLKIGIYQLDLKEKIENYDQEFLELCKEVDEWVRVNPLLPNGDEKLFGQFNNLEGGMLSSYNFKQMNSRSLIPEGPCFWAGNAMCIDPMGNVSVCLLSHTREGVVGNIIDEEVPEILERAKHFRENIEMNGRSSLLHCSGCLKPCGNVHNEATLPPQVNIDSLKESFCNEKKANTHISF
jgi:sulfatase maturation enzyme AslB (radical SAM superfamily)